MDNKKASPWGKLSPQATDEGVLSADNRRAPLRENTDKQQDGHSPSCCAFLVSKSLPPPQPLAL